MKRTRRNYAPGFKAEVALVVIKGGKSLAVLSEQSDVRPNQIADLKQQLQIPAVDVFGGAQKAKAVETCIKAVYAKIGQLTLCR